MAPPSSGVGDLICLLDTPPRCQPNIDTFAAIGAVATVASSAADPAGNALPCGAACAASSNATELPDYLRNNAADGVLAAEPRILFLYAIPLCRGELIYLPVRRCCFQAGKAASMAAASLVALRDATNLRVNRANNTLPRHLSVQLLDWPCEHCLCSCSCLS